MKRTIIHKYLVPRMRNAISDYYHGLIDENIGNPKMVWKTINKVMDKNESTQ